MINQVLSFKNITKKYGNLVALKNISFSIPENSIFGILGANGSGKSTLMKILPGLISNWSGEILYKGNVIKKNSMELKKDFGYLIEAPSFYGHLSAKKNLEILSRISTSNIKRINYVLEIVNLSMRSNDKVDSYSYGMKQRLGIAQSLLHDPEIIILDEPNNGLDPNGIKNMSLLIKNLQSIGKTICLSTHNLRDVEELCTDFTVFNKGVNFIQSSMDKQLQESDNWILVVENTQKAKEIVDESKLFKCTEIFNNKITLKSKSNDTFNDLAALLKSFKIHSISRESNLIEHFNDD